jgi:hypothetical protein
VNRKFNPNYALEIDEEPQDHDEERVEGFAAHSNCGTDKIPESLYTLEIADLRKIPIHKKIEREFYHLRARGF